MLARAEAGEELVITRHGRPVAKLVAYAPPPLTPERQAAIERMVARIRAAPALGRVRRFTRDEMHER
jgi:antitoxin (DNA-binding transcriptional repressor) of toxin-antitoxin stability system